MPSLIARDVGICLFFLDWLSIDFLAPSSGWIRADEICTFNTKATTTTKSSGLHLGRATASKHLQNA
ncbi:hypothetical protein AMS68_004982 [Peltaster fructicola]|uniref:Uncharacterized protein n=1 Tax=Peltaster fructicola TaxID=286661 RepID=A0A6H0XXT1_9PEZI|nr:hypothetical protein AMS68_004982 [Peltaster fructicola]